MKGKEKKKYENRGPIRPEDSLSISQSLFLGLQHVFTMFGGVILVPLFTGLNTSVTLFGVGVATLVFHFITKKKVPVFLGSSISFIAPLALVINEMSLGVPAAQGGIIVAGVIHIIAAVIIYYMGTDFIKSLLPPIVTGPIIMVIGLNLAPVAINSASENWLIALIVLLVVTYINIFAKGFMKLIPIIFGIIVGYLVSLFFNIIDFTPIIEAPWFAIPKFTAPVFNWTAIGIIAPVAVATIAEHCVWTIYLFQSFSSDKMLFYPPCLCN